jgi:hypothetical protein
MALTILLRRDILSVRRQSRGTRPRRTERVFVLHNSVTTEYDIVGKGPRRSLDIREIGVSRKPVPRRGLLRL